ncbi:MAG: OmpA family protein [Candidatus Rokuibacteriota bacterium]
MSEGTFLDISGDGVAAGYPYRTVLPKLVSPSTGDEFNTLQPHLETVGCALVPDHQFEYDSSFVLPGAQRAFRKLVALIKTRPKCPLSVFGHADPEGPDRYNKVLSGRRALAVYAVLVRDASLWDNQLYGDPEGGDRWGDRAIGLMRGALGRDTAGAARPAGAARRQLFLDYMDFLCSDAQGTPFKVAKKDFLGKGADRGGKADYQGCSEFNPVLLFSERETRAFKEDPDKTARNEANAPNRRVLVLLFKEGTEINPKKWPCPRASEGKEGCITRFWSDGEQRRSRLESHKRRQFQESHDTFACRFYHGLAAHAPCESALKLWVVRLLIDSVNGKRVALSNRRYAVTAGDTANAPILRGITDDQGILRVPVYDELVNMKLKLDTSGIVFGPPQAGGGSGSGSGGPGSAGSGAGAPGAGGSGAGGSSGTGSGGTGSSGTGAGAGAPGAGGAGTGPGASGSSGTGAGAGAPGAGGSAGTGPGATAPAPGGPTASAPGSAPWDGEDKFREFLLKGGLLLPIDTPNVDAAKQRLANLGFGTGDSTTWDRRTELFAVRAFQRMVGLDPSGGINDDTARATRREHGG